MCCGGRREKEVTPLEVQGKPRVVKREVRISAVGNSWKQFRT